MYTRTDPSIKLEALESVVAPKLRSGRFKATDKLIAELRTVLLCGVKSGQDDRWWVREERTPHNNILNITALCCALHKAVFVIS